METILSSSLLELIIGTVQWNNTYQQYLAVLHVKRRSVWKTNKRSSSWGWPTWRSTWRRWHGKDARLVETKRFLQTPDAQDDDVDQNEHFHNQSHLDKVGIGKKNAQKTQKFDVKSDLLFVDAKEWLKNFDQKKVTCFLLMQKSDLKSCGSKKVWPKKSVTWKVWHKKYDFKKSVTCCLLMQFRRCSENSR